MNICIGDTIVVTNKHSPFYGEKFEVSDIVWPPVHLFGKKILIYAFDKYHGKKRELFFDYDEVEKVIVFSNITTKELCENYYRNDVITTERLWPKTNPHIATNNHPSIKRVIFNPPATIVFWSDGTKTVVKANGDDIFDPEKGLAMAISKKALGNKGNYYNVFKRFIPDETFEHNMTAVEVIEKFAEAIKKTWTW